MTAYTFAALVVVSTLAAAWLGLHAQRLLPDRYTDEATKGSVKAVLAMLSVLVTVVLGFITADAKRSFDNAGKIVAETAVRLVLIDRMLAELGEDADPIRREMRQAAQEWVARLNSLDGDVNPSVHVVQRVEQLEELFGKIKSLSPKSDAQAKDRERAADLAAGILHDRWVLATGRLASTPTVFLLVVLAWLALEFFLFGVFAPRNACVTAAVVLASLTTASAIFLLLDLEGPLTGPMRISIEPLVRAVSILGG